MSSVVVDVEAPATVDVLGTRIFVGDVVSAAGLMVERALAGSGGYVCLCNVHLFVTARHDEEVARALAGATLVFPDGWPIAWLQRRVGDPSASRVGGPDLMATTIDKGRSFGVRHFLLGSSEDVLSRLAENIAVRFPGAQIAGRRALPFFEGGAADLAEPAIAEVREARPHLVWLSLGCPKQELWMLRHVRELAPSLVAGVGAAFAFHAGTKKRAPEWAQRRGLEWLHRLLSEPRRLGPRYLRTNSEFLLLVAGELLRPSRLRSRGRAQSDAPGRERPPPA